MATTVDIDTRAYIDEIRALIGQSGLACDVEIVPSIQVWSETHGVAEESPFRTGKIVRNTQTGQYVILLPECITSDMVSSVVVAMELRGLTGETDQLSDSLAFVRHLVLHEIAHGLDDTRTEEACDRWAFDQLRKSPFNPTVERDARKSGARSSP